MSMFKKSIAVASLVALVGAASAQTSLWAKAHTAGVGLRFLNGTKAYTGQESLRAYDLFNGKYMNKTAYNLPFNREVSTDGTRFLIHADALDQADFVYYLNGNTPVTISFPYERMDEFSNTMHATTKLTRDGKYVLQIWENGDSDWYSATTGAHIGTGRGPIVEVADGKAVTYKANGYLASVNLQTGAVTSFPFGTPYLFKAKMGRNNLLVGQANTGSAYSAINLTTGVATPLNLQTGDQVAGIFSDGKTIAITNPQTKQAFVQVPGSMRKLVSTSISVSPDGTRGILAKNGIQRPFYNYGNNTSFTVDETDYTPFSFDTMNRAVLDLGGKVLRTLGNDGATVSDTAMPAVPEGATAVFTAKDGKTLVYRLGAYYHRIDIPTGSDTVWFNTEMTPDWSIAYSPNTQAAVLYGENPATHIVNVTYIEKYGNAFELPVGTLVRGIAPNGRILTTQWTAGKAWLRYYEPITGALKKSILVGTADFTQNFAWSGDGNTVAAQTTDGFRLIDVASGTVRKIGGQANAMVDLAESGSEIQLSQDGSLMSFGPMVFRTSNYKSVFCVPGSTLGKGVFSPDGLRFVYMGENTTEAFTLPILP
ncbi:hypothetical protein EON81_15200 [bacterium]|nr:MAG: hypothetical protein EON81_15200 [bacterium]